MMKDSTISQFLMVILLSLPIQQFISCFYVIPDQYGFFDFCYDLHKDSSKLISDVEAPSSASLLKQEDEDSNEKINESVE